MVEMEEVDMKWAGAWRMRRWGWDARVGDGGRGGGKTEVKAEIRRIGEGGRNRGGGSGGRDRDESGGRTYFF